MRRSQQTLFYCLIPTRHERPPMLLPPAVVFPEISHFFQTVNWHLSADVCFFSASLLSFHICSPTFYLERSTEFWMLYSFLRAGTLFLGPSDQRRTLVMDFRVYQLIKFYWVFWCLSPLIKLNLANRPLRQNDSGLQMFSCSLFTYKALSPRIRLALLFTSANAHVQHWWETP